jgi:hypothetical protein
MAFTKQVDDKEWDKISYKLTNYLGICGCQRKLKSIIDVLVRIYDKGQAGEHNWTPEEYLILAMLDSRGLITHGVNCEYPIILHMTRNDDDFWEWVNSVKDNPNLDDN